MPNDNHVQLREIDKNRKVWRSLCCIVPILSRDKNPKNPVFAQNFYSLYYVLVDINKIFAYNTAWNIQLENILRRRLDSARRTRVQSWWTHGVHATKPTPTLFRTHRKHRQTMGFIRFQDSDTLSRSGLILEPDTSTLEHKTAIPRNTKTVSTSCLRSLRCKSESARSLPRFVNYTHFSG